ncbi:MAG: hypothetical protein WD342_14510 [Verrucomicrobiales bacterium]
MPWKRAAEATGDFAGSLPIGGKTGISGHFLSIWPRKQPKTRKIALFEEKGAADNLCFSISSAGDRRARRNEGDMGKGSNQGRQKGTSSRLPGDAGISRYSAPTALNRVP